MTDFTGTLVVEPRIGDLDKVCHTKVLFTLTEALATTNSYTFTPFIDGYYSVVEDVQLYGVNADTNATPTGTYTLGTTDDKDGLLTTKAMSVALQNSLASQVNYFGDGDLIKNQTVITGDTLELDVTANPATGATAGDIWIDLYFRLVSKNYS
jgi:hypothetical protein